MIKPRLSRPVILTAALLVASLLLTACGAGIPQTGANLPGIAVEFSDTGVSVPASVEGGVTTVTLTNNTQINQSVTFGRLNTDVTLEQFMSAITLEDPTQAVSMVALGGGRDVAPGESNEVILDLKEGTYVVVAFPEQDGPPMTGSFAVTAGSGSGADDPVNAGVTVELADFTFVMPETVQSGADVWAFTNTGGQWHEFAVILPQEGFTQEQFLEMMEQDQQPSGPPPFELVTMFAPISPGERGWLPVDLEPGTYWAICFLPDITSDMTSHAAKGMFREFTVE